MTFDELREWVTTNQHNINLQLAIHDVFDTHLRGKLYLLNSDNVDFDTLKYIIDVAKDFGWNRGNSPEVIYHYLNIFWNVRALKTPSTHPFHDIVGHEFKAYDGNIYFCDSYDPRQGFWMTDIAFPNNRKNVSERAIGNTFHKIYQKE